MKNANIIRGLTLFAALMLVSGVILADTPWPTGGPIREPDLPEIHPCDYIDDIIQCVDSAPLTLFSLPREENRRTLLGELLATRDECNSGNLKGSLAKTLNDVIPNLSIWLVNAMDPSTPYPDPDPDPLFQTACGYGGYFKEELYEDLETMVALLVDEMAQAPRPFEVLYEGQSHYRFLPPYSSEEQYFTIEIQPEWEIFWKAHYPGYPVPPPPLVDFAVERAVAGFLGIRTHGGFGFGVSDVFTVGDVMDLDPYTVVAVDRTAPGGQNVPWNMCNPSFIVSIGRALTDKPIIIIDRYSRNAIDIINIDTDR